jgi:hypothetical protein
MATELTLLAKYTSFVTQPDKILAKSEVGQWAPSTTEFKDIARQGNAKTIREVGDVFDVLDALQTRQVGAKRGETRKPKSLERVNIFAHGDSTAISLNGRVLQPKASAAIAVVTMADGNGRIDSNTLFLLEHEADAERESVFADGAAGIFFYVCESGSHEDILQGLANYFRVDVHGFRGAIAYCPIRDLRDRTVSLRRGASGLFYKMGEAVCDNGVFDFHALVPSVKKSPQKKQPAPGAPTKTH